MQPVVLARHALATDHGTAPRFDAKFFRATIVRIAMTRRTLACSLLTFLALAGLSSAGTIWVEGEKPLTNNVTRHPWWYDKVKMDELSGGDFISHWDKDKVGEAAYRVEAPSA